MNQGAKMKDTVRAWAVAFVLTLSIVLLCCVSATEAIDWFGKAKSMLEEVNRAAPKERSLTESDIASGLKEALAVGTSRVVKQLGAKDGFNADSFIHIPLPQSFRTVQSALSKIGMSSMLDDLELRLNRAAEEAAPRAKALFIASIKEMTLDDVMGIYKGPDDAATQYFKEKMSDSLAAEMRPVVEDSLSDVGAIAAYDAAVGQYKSIPFAPDVRADLTGHVIEKGMDGIFYYLAKEEAAIRQNPAKRTTELLKKVFGR